MRMQFKWRIEENKKKHKKTENFNLHVERSSYAVVSLRSVCVISRLFIMQHTGILIMILRQSYIRLSDFYITSVGGALGCDYSSLIHYSLFAKCRSSAILLFFCFGRVARHQFSFLSFIFFLFSFVCFQFHFNGFGWFAKREYMMQFIFRSYILGCFRNIGFIRAQFIAYGWIIKKKNMLIFSSSPLNSFSTRPNGREKREHDLFNVIWNMLFGSFDRPHANQTSWAVNQTACDLRWSNCWNCRRNNVSIEYEDRTTMKESERKQNSKRKGNRHKLQRYNFYAVCSM